MKELKIQIPEGYEIDKENSTFERIIFKSKEIDINTWEDLCKIKQENYIGYFVGINSHVNKYTFNDFLNNYCRNLFLTKEEAIRSRVASMISQLMPYYGGSITKEEWEDKYISKYIIRRFNNKIEKIIAHSCYQPYLAFRTEKDRDRFLKYNEDLVKEYLML